MSSAGRRENGRKRAQKDKYAKFQLRLCMWSAKISSAAFHSAACLFSWEMVTNSVLPLASDKTGRGNIMFVVYGWHDEEWEIDAESQEMWCNVVRRRMKLFFMCVDLKSFSSLSIIYVPLIPIVISSASWWIFLFSIIIHMNESSFLLSAR